MSQLAAEMAFEIGDFVYFKASEFTGVEYPKRFQITERVVQECHGGIQRQYRVSADERHLIPEVALTKELPPINAAYAARLEELRSLEDAAQRNRADKHYGIVRNKETGKIELTE